MPLGVKAISTFAAAKDTENIALLAIICAMMGLAGRKASFVGGKAVLSLTRNLALRRNR